MPWESQDPRPSPERFLHTAKETNIRHSRNQQGETSMNGHNLRDALVDEIKDLYNAEKQLTKALPKGRRERRAA
jgi:hypothetical protein